jgi:hypothetical protein
MKTVNQITGYKTSRSFDVLWDLAKNQSIICLCKMRDANHKEICRTIWTDSLVEISARGTCYVCAATLEKFIEQCELYKIEWVLPETQYLGPQE